MVMAKHRYDCQHSYLMTIKIKAESRVLGAEVNPADSN